MIWVGVGPVEQCQQLRHHPGLVLPGAVPTRAQGVGLDVGEESAEGGGGE